MFPRRASLRERETDRLTETTAQKRERINQGERGQRSNRWDGAHVHLLWMAHGGGSPCSHGCLRHLRILHCHWVKLIDSCGNRYTHNCLRVYYKWEL